ncbi:MAG: cytidylyltransferase [Prevotella sp.]|nr:cytidylyltransferase [Prevotella sp.]MBP3712353.1 cytidylyltransferase [Bacteroidaceae bacterium]MBQ9169357.1 cytidylyltransferase [Bacteroidaceae bacterium]MBQ9171439.1 cytidylyltransferase [Bacteroidaceae bacterium]MBQ9295048.1 cytidylyltransferase [Bacteroidaceae bacterium]
MKITAVIPVRTGSQRVHDKNLRPFADSTLLDIKIRELQKVEELSCIIVNTNSDELVSRINRQYAGGKVRAQRREDYYASSACSGSEFFQHLGEVTDTDIFVYTPCTSPFIKAETISRCIQTYLKERGQGCDSVSTVSSVKEFLWLDGKAINYDPRHAPNSQDLPDIVALNFGCSVISRDRLISGRNIIGKKPKFVTDTDIEAIDIDTPLDFYIAEQLYIKLNVEHKGILD